LLYWINKEDIDLDIIDNVTNTYPVYKAKLRTGSYVLNSLQTEMTYEMGLIKRSNPDKPFYHYFVITLDIDTDVVTFVSLILSQLTVNPLTTIINTGVITVNAPSHGYVTGDNVYILGATNTAGIQANTLNGFHKIVVINTKTLTAIDEIRYYVRPTLNPILTKFCTNLTGIEQSTVDEAESFPLVFKKILHWIKCFEEEYSSNWCFVTCGDWDLKTMLPRQEKMNRLSIPKAFKRWINIKVPFNEHFGIRGYGMTSMLDTLGLELVGRHHSGLDDCRNTGAIAIELMKRAVVFNISSKLIN
jgi:inhibitor of KinA sporulation pathway (predicted exonuclease)